MPKTTHIFLDDPALVDRLKVQAGRERRSRKAVVIRALERYFEAQEEKLRLLARTEGEEA